MKKTLKVLPYLLFLTIIFSCQKENFENDLPETQNEFNLDLKYSRVNFNEVSKKSVKSLRKISKNSNGFAHNRDSNQTTFSIDTSSVVRIDVENQYTSYTFSVINDEDTNLLQNIIISEKADSTSTIYLAEYVLDVAYSEVVDNNIDDHVLESDYYQLDDETTLNYQSRIPVTGDGADCVDINTSTVNFCEDSEGNTMIDNGQLGNGCSQNWTTQEITTITIDVGCLGGGGGSGDGTSGDGTSGDGSGNGNNGGGTTGDGTTGGSGDDDVDNEDCLIVDENGNCLEVVTTPVLNIKSHRFSLKQQTDNIKIKNRIAELKAVVNSTLNEDGSQFDLIENSNPVDYDVVAPIETGSNNTKFPDTRLNTLVNLHLHPKFGFVSPEVGAKALSPIFSHVDLEFMLDFFDDTDDNQDISSILVSIEGVFALRVTDSERADKMEKKLNKKRHWIRFVDKFIDDVLTSPEGEPEYTNEEIIEHFITFLNTYTLNNSDDETGLGLTLFEATVDSDGNITGWVQKS